MHILILVFIVNNNRLRAIIKNNLTITLKNIYISYIIQGSV